MKAVAQYVAWLLTFIFAAFGVSWCAVYSFWFSAQLFQSVPAVRICNAVASVILIPAHVFFWLMHDVFDPIGALTSPVFYAAVNGLLLGVIGYASCRRWIFATKPPG